MPLNCPAYQSWRFWSWSHPASKCTTAKRFIFLHSCNWRRRIGCIKYREAHPIATYTIMTSLHLHQSVCYCQEAQFTRPPALYMYGWDTPGQIICTVVPWVHLVKSCAVLCIVCHCCCHICVHHGLHSHRLVDCYSMPGRGGGSPTPVTTVGSRRVNGTVCLNYVIVHTVLLCSVREWYIHPCLDSLSSARCFKAPGKESKSGPMDSTAWRLHWASKVLANAVISFTQFVSGSFNFQLL